MVTCMEQPQTITHNFAINLLRIAHTNMENTTTTTKKQLRNTITLCSSIIPTSVSEEKNIIIVGININFKKSQT
jgi:hypothetical protein